MLKTLKFKSSFLFETHTLSDRSLRVLPFPIHLSNQYLLTAKGQ